MMLNREPEGLLSVVEVDPATGALLVDKRELFPIIVSDGPPLGAKAPNGDDALAELAAGGASFIRTGRSIWTSESIEQEIAAERAVLDAAAAHGLHCWLRLGNVADLSARGLAAREQLLTGIVTQLKDHPALGAWKGVDEPANPNRPTRVPVAGLVRAYRALRETDRDHPVVITQAPVGTVAELAPYRPAFDITGADIYPVSYPPGKHAGGPDRDIGVVGDVTRKMVKAAGRKPIWMTLQIAWSGVVPSRQHPGNVPRFPTLNQERFMAYQAIVNGARGLSFFGGQLTQVARPADAKAGWNWTFWELVLRPLLEELTSSSVAPSLVAPDASKAVKASSRDVELVTREAGGFLYVIAVRRGSGTSRVTFSGLPRRQDRQPITGGEVLFEYVQDPLPPPVEPSDQTFRTVRVAAGRFRDWFAQHDVHVYRFRL
jgi:hypothetical protein